MRPRPLSEVEASTLSGVSLLATDIDGTMTRGGKIPPEVLEACERLHQSGVEVVPVTGRSAGEALGLARYLPRVGRAVAENGAVLVEPDAPVRWLFGEADPSRLHEVARRIGFERPLRPAPCAPFRVADAAFERDGRETAELRRLQSAAMAEGVHLVWSSVHVHLSLHPPDKGAGLERLLAGETPASAVAVIGDAPNDEGFWRPGRFGLPVGTSAVLNPASGVGTLPSWFVGEGADGWVELARAISRARDAVRG
ncbi:MAG: hypothetical protein RL199_450 [Pseudomonadota bacterium]|jgi:hydroxymethylpyrimidine pyrophosphatase-like HAD family hydrolase